jgi:hypothetical protein
VLIYCGLFTSFEPFINTIAKTRCIVKRRTAFEYKLQRRIVQEADFLRYIQVS